jgi:hypothetical protein
MQVIPEHKDILERPLNVGDYVAFPESNILKIGIIQKLNPKMLTIKGITSSWNSKKYPKDCAKLDGPELTMFILKR